MLSIICSLFFCFSFLSVNATDYYVIEGSNKEFVSISYILGTAIRLLDKYENHEIAGFEMAYDQSGYYFDADKGPNWWNYYFEPLSVGDKSNCEPQRVPNYLKFMLGSETLFEMAHERKQYLIAKYIRIHPELQQKVDEIVAQQFSNNIVIGVVHYDHKISNKDYITHVTLDDIYDAINNQLKQHSGIDNYKIFLVTNDEMVVDAMRMRFQDHLICLDLVHPPAKDGKKLECWLLHLLLLTKTDIFIDTGSMLGILAKSFNMALKWIDLDIHYALK
jgi:hypothetical protein